jgi:hypothetical protein
MFERLIPKIIKLPIMERLARSEVFKNRSVRKYWPVYYMADEYKDAVEFAQFCPFRMVPPTPELKDELEIPNSIGHYGPVTTTKLIPGEIEVKLAPSSRFYGMTKVQIKDQDTIVIEMKGLGGVPSFFETLAVSSRNCTRKTLDGGGVEFHMEFPLYNRVIMGLDDTDSSTKGATVETALDIATIIEAVMKPKVRFIRMLTVLNFPNLPRKGEDPEGSGPHKTTNNASSLCIFAVRPDKLEEIVRLFAKLARKFSLSRDTGMAWMNRILIPEELTKYSREVKTRVVRIDEAYNVAEKVRAEIIPIGRKEPWGVVGATAALGWTDLTVEGFTPPVI